MRLQLKNNRVQPKTNRIHGGMIKNPRVHSQNVQNLQKSFAGLLGRKKNVKFSLKL